MFVPFGKPECFGSGQLALLATGRTERPGPRPVTAGRLHSSSGGFAAIYVQPGPPGAADRRAGGRIKKQKAPHIDKRGFTGLGVPLQWETCEQGSGFCFSASLGVLVVGRGAVGMIRAEKIAGFAGDSAPLVFRSHGPRRNPLSRPLFWGWRNAIAVHFASPFFVTCRAKEKRAVRLWAATLFFAPGPTTSSR